MGLLSLNNAYVKRNIKTILDRNEQFTKNVVTVTKTVSKATRKANKAKRKQRRLGK